MQEFKTFGTYFLIIGSSYLSLSFTEWFLHKFFMHNPNISIGKYHILHHVNTHDNMQLLNKDKTVGILTETQNLCFGTETILIGSAVICIFVPTLRLFTTQIYHTLAAVISLFFFSIYSVIVWNALHPYIHHENGAEICPLGTTAISYSTMKYLHRHNPLMRFLYDNHVTHHRIKGEKKGNFNVTHQ